MVLVSVGVRPTAHLAKAAGIKLGETGAIAVDDHMRTSAPHVYAAGDCAEAFHLIAKKPTYLPLGDTANKQGKVAGANAAGGDETFGGIVGSAGFKVFELEVARTGLGQPEIDGLGLKAIAAPSKHASFAHGYPGSKPIQTILFAETGSGRLLGAQMVGAATVGKRIDVFAVALHAGLTVDQVEGLDLVYAPPISPVYDPILIAATVTKKALAKARR
jgi:NADPH-dependent 2,4-dienoyl-CoA reductase/sulfur reductase-like enzyme